MKAPQKVSAARQRLLETADRLFYTDGIRAVGIDRVIAEAGVAKMTLYTHFPSKDALILAVLQHREENFTRALLAAIDRHAARHKDPLRAFFAALKEWVETPEFRGCPFVNSFVQLADNAHPGAVFVREQKLRFSAFLTEVVEKAVGKVAPKLAATITLLVEGAVVSAAIQNSPDAINLARDAALKWVHEAKQE